MPRLRKVTAAAVFGVGAAVVAAVGAVGWTFSWHWGDVPTWVGALATLAALGAATAGAVGVFHQLRSLTEQADLQREALALQIQQADADRAERDRRVAQELEIHRIGLRRQAEQIDITPAEHGQMHEGLGKYVTHLSLHVENASERPIRNVGCRAWTGEGQRAPSGTCQFVDSDGRWIATEQTPGSGLEVLRRHAAIDFVFGSVEDLGRGLVYVLRFTDDAGLHWQLDDTMHLVKIADRTDW